MVAISKPRKEPSPENNPDPNGILVLDFQPSKLWENKFLFKLEKKRKKKKKRQIAYLVALGISWHVISYLPILPDFSISGCLALLYAFYLNKVSMKDPL